MEEETTNKRNSTKYRSQASRYASDKVKLVEMLNELKRTTVDVEEMLTSSHKDVKNDFFTTKIDEGNKNIKIDADEIITKLESISSSLTSKAIELDRIDNEAAEIEEQ